MKKGEDVLTVTGMLRLAPAASRKVMVAEPKARPVIVKSPPVKVAVATAVFELTGVAYAGVPPLTSNGRETPTPSTNPAAGAVVDKGVRLLTVTAMPKVAPAASRNEMVLVPTAWPVMRSVLPLILAVATAALVLTGVA